MRPKRYHKSAALLADPVHALAKLRSKIVVSPDTGCHNWQGSIGEGGYGQIGIEGRIWSAHRLMFELTKGHIPPRFQCTDGRYFVLHECDNRKCCNPDHLHLGSPKDNAKGMADRCRVRHGERASRSGSSTDAGAGAGTVFWEFRGEIRSLKDWSVASGIEITSLDRRFKSGWPEDDIFSRPTLGLRRKLGAVQYRRFSGVAAAEAAIAEIKKIATGPRSDGTEWSSTRVHVTPRGLTVLAKAFPPVAASAA